MAQKWGARGGREGGAPVAWRGDQVRGAGEVQLEVQLLMGGTFVILQEQGRRVGGGGARS